MPRDAPLLALGVVTRGAVPAERPQAVPPRTVVRYVVRQLGPESAAPRLAGDVLFFTSRRAFTRTTGPVYSTLRWYGYALEVLRPAFVAHAEDDAFVDFGFAALAARHLVPHVPAVAGRLEIFHWDTAAHAAHAYWSHFYARRTWRCVRAKARVVGPFPMLKGPFHIWDAATARLVLASEAVRNESAAVLARRRGAPWDDVFLGFALAVVPVANLTFVSLGNFYAEWPRPRTRPLHHKPNASGAREPAPRALKMSCAARPFGISCAGAELRYCRAWSA